MTNDEGRKAEAWWALKARFAQHGPAAGLPLPAYFVPPRWNGLEGIGLGVVTVGIDHAKDNSGGSTPQAGAVARAFD